MRSRSKSFLTFVVWTSLFALGGYYVLSRMQSENTSLHKHSRRAASKPSKAKKAPREDLSSQVSVSSRLEVSEDLVEDSKEPVKKSPASASVSLASAKLSRKPAAKVSAREQEILDFLDADSETSMSELADRFSHVTRRTLRRDLSKLAAQGRVVQSGTTRSTTYLKT